MNRPDIKSLIGVYKEKIINNKKLFLIILVGVLGMLLVLFSELGERKEEYEPAETQQSADIETQMTNELTSLLRKINGAGRVEVMLTFESSQERVYAYDTDEDISAKNGNGADRQTKSEHIIINGENGEDGLKVKDIYPQIRGVAVVCDGGDDPVIKGQIISVISALFNINSTKISVAKMAG